MKLTAKLVSVFMLGITAVTAVYLYLAVQGQVARFREDQEDYARQVGSVIEKSLAVVWRDRGRAGAMELVSNTNNQQERTTIRWVTLDAPADESERPAAPREALVEAAAGRIISVRTQNQQGQSALNTYYPLNVGDGHKRGLEFASDLSQLDLNTSETIFRTFALLGTMLLVCCMAVALVGMRLVGRPLTQLIEKAQRAGAGDFSGPVQLKSRDELAELAGALNRMCDQLAQSQSQIRSEAASRIATLEQLRHADRLKTVGRLASGIAHELGTPLSVISGRASLIGSGKLSEPESRASADTIKSEADRMAATIRQLLDFARRGAPKRASVDLWQLADRTCELLRPLAQKHNVHFVNTNRNGPLVALIDEGQIQQVLTNLVVNAIQSMPRGGPVTISIARQRTHAPQSADVDKEYIRLDVADQGEGISEENLNHIFEPFFTTKNIGEGTGLGLSIAYGLVQEHNGWIDVASRPGEGTCFSIFLPAGD